MGGLRHGHLWLALLAALVVHSGATNLIPSTPKSAKAEPASSSSSSASASSQGAPEKGGVAGKVEDAKGKVESVIEKVQAVAEEVAEKVEAAVAKLPSPTAPPPPAEKEAPPAKATPATKFSPMVKLASQIAARKQAFEKEVRQGVKEADCCPCRPEWAVNPLATRAIYNAQEEGMIMKGAGTAGGLLGHSVATYPEAGVAFLQQENKMLQKVKMQRSFMGAMAAGVASAAAIVPPALALGALAVLGAGLLGALVAMVVKAIGFLLPSAKDIDKCKTAKGKDLVACKGKKSPFSMGGFVPKLPGLLDRELDEPDQVEGASIPGTPAGKKKVFGHANGWETAEGGAPFINTWLYNQKNPGHYLMDGIWTLSGDYSGDMLWEEGAGIVANRAFYGVSYKGRSISAEGLWAETSRKDFAPKESGTFIVEFAADGMSWSGTVGEWTDSLRIPLPPPTQISPPPETVAMDTVALSRVIGDPQAGPNQPSKRWYINPDSVQKIKAVRKVPTTPPEPDEKKMGGNPTKYVYPDYKGGAKLEDMYNVLQTTAPNFAWQGGKCCECVDGQPGKPTSATGGKREINSGFTSPYGANGH